jgi:hypothetical protein
VDTGNGEADAHAAARARVDRGVDAHQVAVDVDQRAARVAGVDGGVGLDEVLEGVDAQLVAAQRADDAAGDRLAHAEGVADGQHLVAHLQRVGVAQRDDRQPVERDLQDGEVGSGSVPITLARALRLSLRATSISSRLPPRGCW